MTVEVPVLKHLSDRARERTTVEFHGLPVPDYVKKHPKPISLSGGRPHEGFYPITKIAYDFTEEPYGEPVSTGVFNKTEDDKVNKLDLKRALNYGPTEGWPQLINFCKDLVTFVNKPGYNAWNITMTNGSADSLHKVFNLLINPGDTVLMEGFTFVPTINNIRAWGGDIVPVAMNFADGGIDVEKLEEQLSSWSTGPYKDKSMPKCLYTIPTGQNPTGLTLKLENRKKVLALAKKYDFIIVEDDPYGYIQLGVYTDGKENPFTEGYDAKRFVEERMPKSYLQLDNEGRVIRLETFSKVFAPGSRLGFMVGHNDLISHVVKHADCSTRAASGISQATLLTAIQHFKGVAGWIRWCVKVSKTYTDRKNIFLSALLNSEAYKKGYFTCNEPDAGMFITIDLNFPQSDDHRLELEEFGYKAIENGVAVVLGKNMAFTPEYSKEAKFLRLTVATAQDDDELLEAANRLIKAIEDYFQSS
jgi:aromatic amino acid aminotransferase II